MVSSFRLMVENLRLGEKLVADRLITLEQLEVALRAQVIYGARLGTNLVELGHIDLDTLARALAEITGAPAALGAHFEQVAGDPATLALVPAELAEKHHAVPLGLARLAGRQLVVAFMDPANAPALEEIGAAAGAKVVACVAPELRILYYLEKYYGIPRKNRFLRIEHKTGPERPRVGASTQAATLPVAEDRRRYVEPANERAEPGPDAVAEAGAAPTAAPAAPPAAGPPRRPVLTVRPMAMSLGGAAAPGRPALAARDAASKMGIAVTRDDIGDAVVDYLRSGFACGAVLIARDDLALGWKGFSPGADAAAIEAVAMPLGPPSMFRLAFEGRSPFRGVPPVEGTPIQTRFWKALRVAPPREVIVAPIVIRDRVVNLIYAHPPGGGTLPDAAVADVATVCTAAATAYARLIRSTRPHP
jgi:type II secretion system (T2SS) protein E